MKYTHSARPAPGGCQARPSAPRAAAAPPSAASTTTTALSPSSVRRLVKVRQTTGQTTGHTTDTTALSPSPVRPRADPPSPPPPKRGRCVPVGPGPAPRRRRPRARAFVGRGSCCRLESGQTVRRLVRRLVRWLVDGSGGVAWLRSDLSPREPEPLMGGAFMEGFCLESRASAVASIAEQRPGKAPDAAGRRRRRRARARFEARFGGAGTQARPRRRQSPRPRAVRPPPRPQPRAPRHGAPRVGGGQRAVRGRLGKTVRTLSLSLSLAHLFPLSLT